MDNKLTDKEKELWEERNRIYESLKATKAELEEYRTAYLTAQADIERLMKTTKDAQKNCKESIELLGKYAEKLQKMRAEAIKTKSEAIKEFAERLKENAVTHNCRYEGQGYDIKAVTTYDIDRFLLETVGDKE